MRIKNKKLDFFILKEKKISIYFKDLWTLYLVFMKFFELCVRFMALLSKWINQAYLVETLWTDSLMMLFTGNLLNGKQYDWLLFEFASQEKIIPRLLSNRLEVITEITISWSKNLPLLYQFSTIDSVERVSVIWNSKVYMFCGLIFLKFFIIKDFCFFFN